MHSLSFGEYILLLIKILTFFTSFVAYEHVFLGRSEYQLAAYQTQLAEKPEKVIIPLSFPKDFGRRYEAEGRMFAPPPLPRPISTLLPSSSTSAVPEAKERVSVGPGGELLTGGLVAALIVGFGLVALLIQRADRRQASKGRAAGRTILRIDAPGARAARWEWQAPPAPNEDEKSIELDEFVVSTHDSLSNTRAGSSAPP